MSKDTSLIKAIDAMGSVSALAAALGVTKQAVSAWDRVPAKQAMAVNKLTGIPLYVLRPDVYPQPRKDKQTCAMS